MKKLVINLGSNSDIRFISDVLADSLCSNKNDTYLTVNTKDQKSPSAGSFHPVFVAKKATSPLQVINLFIAIYYILKMRGCKMVCFTAPSPCNILLIPICFALKKKIISVVHDVEPHYTGPRGWLYAIQNRLIFKLSGFVFLFSLFSYHQAIKIYQYYKGGLAVLPLPTPAEEAINNNTSGLAEKKYDFIWWGRPEEYKGIDLLPRFADYIAKYNMNLLVLSRICKSSKLYGALKKRDNVVLVSAYVGDDDLVDYIKLSSVNICPYISATQSGVISFCSFLGTPSLVSNVGGLPEQVGNGEAGFVIEDFLNFHVEDVMERLSEISEDKIKNVYQEKHSRDAMRAKVKEVVEQ